MGAISDKSYKQWGYGTGKDQVDIATQNRLNNPYGSHTLLGITLSNLLPQAISGGLEYAAKAGSKSEKGEKGEESDNAKIEELNKKLVKLLGEIGAKNETDINEAVSRAQDKRDTKIQAAQDKIDVFTNGTDEYTTRITGLQNEYNALTDETDPDGTERTRLQKEIKSEEAKRQKALEAAQKELKNVTETENKKVEDICLKATEAFQVVEQLNALGDNSASVVEEQKEALYAFATARNIFQNAETDEERKQSAATLKDLYENNPNNKTITTAYEKILKPQVEACLTKKAA